MEADDIGIPGQLFKGGFMDIPRCKAEFVFVIGQDSRVERTEQPGKRTSGIAKSHNPDRFPGKLGPAVGIPDP